MSPELLMEQINIQKSDSTMVYDYINRLAYLQVAFFGDLTTEWNIQFSETFLEQVQSLDEAAMNVLFFYLALVRRGILFLHKFIGNNVRH